MATIVARRFILTVLFMAAAAVASAQVAIPTESDWLDHGMAFSAGALGQDWDAVLEGGTPTSIIKKDGTYYLYYVGSYNYISQIGNEGPGGRNIGLATSTDGVNWTKYGSGPVLSFSVTGNHEEGTPTGSILWDDATNQFVAYYGANIAPNINSLYINADIRVATSADGLSFTGDTIVTHHSNPAVWGYGDEVHPYQSYTDGTNYYAYYIPNGVPQSNRLAVAWGSSYDSLTNYASVPAPSIPPLVRGPGSVIELGGGQLAYFNSYQSDMSVRTTTTADPLHLSAEVETYTDLPGIGRIVLLDQDRQTWFMYYNGWSYTGMMTAPVGAPDATGPSAPPTPGGAAAAYNTVNLNWGASTDADTGVLKYNVYRDGSPIGSTTAQSFQDTTTAELTSYSYEIRPVNLHGTEGAASPVNVNTPADLTAPDVHAAAAGGNATVLEVIFDEAMNPATANNPANYALDNGVSVLGASLGPDNRTVTLTTTPKQSNTLYTLQVSNVADASAAGNLGSPQRQFTYSGVPGMMGYYRMDAAGATSDDTSGYGHHGQVQSTPTAAAGQVDGALHFDGVDDYLEIADTPELDDTFAGNFTVTAWVQPEDVPPHTTSSNRAYAVFTSPNITVNYDADQQFAVTARTDGGNASVSTATMAPGAWHHLAVVVDADAGQLSFYVDGNLVGGASTSLPGAMRDPTAEVDEISWMDQYYGNYWIGAGDPLFDYESNFFKGLLDDVRIFDHALSLGEVVATIPEPATLGLLLLGGLAPVRRRRL